MVQWILLAAVVIVVGGVYWYLRRHNGGDPWQGMDDDRSDEEIAARGESLGGESYIVGVRTLSPGGAGQSGGGDDHGAASDAEAQAAWEAYKKMPETTPTPSTPTATPPAQASAAPSRSAPAEPQPNPGPRPDPEPQPSPEPQLSADPERVPEPSAPARMDNIRPARPPAGEEKIFVLHVASAEGVAFDGPDIHAALNAEGLKFGLNDFYHRVTDANGELESVYSVANMLKPGALDPVEQDHLRTPGLTLFLILPGAISGGQAMRDMMETANNVARQLGGQVLDDQRNLLKAQSAQYILDQIAELDRQARLREAR